MAKNFEIFFQKLQFSGPKTFLRWKLRWEKFQNGGCYLNLLCSLKISYKLLLKTDLLIKYLKDSTSLCATSFHVTIHIPPPPEMSLLQKKISFNAFIHSRVNPGNFPSFFLFYIHTKSPQHSMLNEKKKKNMHTTRTCVNRATTCATDAVYGLCYHLKLSVCAWVIVIIL